jgi:hypothetical protein
MRREVIASALCRCFEQYHMRRKTPRRAFATVDRRSARLSCPYQGVEYGDGRQRCNRAAAVHAAPILAFAATGAALAPERRASQMASAGTDDNLR